MRLDHAIGTRKAAVRDLMQPKSKRCASLSDGIGAGAREVRASATFSPHLYRQPVLARTCAISILGRDGERGSSHCLVFGK